MIRSRWLAPLLMALAAAASWAALGGPGARAAGPVAATIWVQTMDSCKQALGGGGYVLTGGGATLHADSPAATKARVSSTTQCPLQQGDCRAAGGIGCVSFTGVAPGTYTLREVRTPAADTSNPEGYAPCEGGSACRSEVGAVTVAADGRVTATVTNVYPDGVSVTWPSSGGRRGHTAYAATQNDPVVFHDFGLAPPGRSGQCDGDSDADDHLTGSPSGHCAYPEAEEDAACKPYPWSCAGGTPPPGSRPGA
ncbi:MAG TPA: hypothetical protein VH134_07280 [Candidatus Dormibacteraeota bacterium]|jgi:hypothetical protein|nr:hypothetical protein [Candidatus Dormibacteraeota bacterium]